MKIYEWLTRKSRFSDLDNLVYSERLIGIYKITNEVNGNIYIGQSVNLITRLISHRNNYKNPKLEGKALYKAIKKHGLENFSIEILEICSINELNDFEKLYIEIHQAYTNGYNQTLGGEDNPSNNPEVVARRRQTLLYDKEVNSKLRLVGEKNPRALLTESDVLDMRKRYDLGESTRSIYEDFKHIKYDTYQSALYGDSWRHLDNIKNRKVSRKLTKLEVYNIRQGYMDGMGIKELMLKYGSRYEQIRRIITLDRWKDEETIPIGFIEYVSTSGEESSHVGVELVSISKQ